METVKISARGQITIPYAIRKKMNLKGGDTVAFVEKEDKIYLETTQPQMKSRETIQRQMRGLKAIQHQMQGKAKNAGFNTVDDVTAYIEQIPTRQITPNKRSTVRGWSIPLDNHVAY
jgi:AbrB family looped-hinge helix DNA binding protein